MTDPSPPPGEATPLEFRLLNVFALPGDPFSGNPLCVFPRASGLSGETMQALARQFNLSETSFVRVPPEPGPVAAEVRIFTPSIELPFAGHPTLGTAHVVRDLTGAGDEVLLRMPSGEVPVTAHGDTWTLRARSPRTRPVELATAELASMLGLAPDAIAGNPLWVDTGVEQLLLPLRSVADVRRARPSPELLDRYARASLDEALVYLWADRADGPAAAVEARLFFTQDGAVVEDPATGSACANLGGWLVAQGRHLPTGIRLRVHQGAAVQRPSVLDLAVEADGAIFVTGLVREVGRGAVILGPDQIVVTM